MEMAEIIQIISIGLLWSQLLLIMDNFFLFCLLVTISEFMLTVRAMTSFFYTMTSWNMALQSNF